MSIRTRFLLIFSVTSIIIIGLVFAFIYTIFSEYREEEFQKRQKEKITSTLSIMSEVQEIESKLLKAIDKLALNQLYDEKLLIYDASKTLWYSSLDDVAIPYAQDILDQLSPQKPWIELKDGDYDVIGVYVENDGNGFYGISKANDNFGQDKLRFLRYVMVGTFLGISLIVILLSYYLAEKVTRPLLDITNQITQYNFEEVSLPICVQDAHKEVALLATRFNELMQKMKEAFAFQKHAIHHISHELKTPIAVLVSNFERIDRETDVATIKHLIEEQKEGTIALSEIINALLEMAKVESGTHPIMEEVRIDELLYDVIAELNTLYPNFIFQLEYDVDMEAIEELNLTIKGNERLIRSALTNLLLNSILYNQEKTTQITIVQNQQYVLVKVLNKGITIPKEEQPFLFQHFYRGESSKGIRGFGLGLVFIQKIMRLHDGTITYSIEGENSNVFEITLPLS